MIKMLLQHSVKQLLLWGILVLFLLSNHQVFAASGELITTVRIGDLHGWVYTYDSEITPVNFGLKVSWDIVDNYIPPSGFLQSIVPEGQIELNLTCVGICQTYLDLTHPNTLLTDKINIEAGRKNFLNFVINPTNSWSITISTSSNLAAFNPSNLVTISGKTLYKSQKMLDWVLGVHDAGFYNEAINNIYKKVINIVNGFLIIALLLIAAAWNFSFLISTKNLRRALMFFALLSIVVTFMLPASRLAIDLAETVQGSFLTKTNGARITANDLIAVKINSDWSGKIQNSWTPLGLPDQTQWSPIAWPIFYSDFDQQSVLAVDITPKGNGIYFTATDCQIGRNEDYNMLHISDVCQIGAELKIATCDQEPSSTKWVLNHLKCIK